MEKLGSQAELISLSVRKLKIKNFATMYAGVLICNIIVYASSLAVERIEFKTLLALILITPLLPPIYSWLKPRPNAHSVANLTGDTLSLLGYEFEKESMEWITYYVADDTKHVLCVKLVGYEPFEVHLTRADFIDDMRLFKFIAKHFHSIKLVDDLI